MTTKIVTGNTLMGASGANHAPGTVPDPGATAGTVKFLREDAIFSQPVASGVTNAADLTAANIFTQLNTFDSGIQIGAGPTNFAQLLYFAGTIFIQGLIGPSGTTPVAFGLQNISTTVAAILQAQTAEVGYGLETTVGGITYVGETAVESTVANFLNSSNTIEYQIGVQKGGATPIPPKSVAIGDNAVQINPATTFGSTVTLHADPTTNLQAATKQYVDGKFTAGFSGTVPLAKLTVGGANGSLTVANGLITTVVNPT